MQKNLTSSYPWSLFLTPVSYGDERNQRLNFLPYISLNLRTVQGSIQRGSKESWLLRETRYVSFQGIWEARYCLTTISGSKNVRIQEGCQRGRSSQMLSCNDLDTVKGTSQFLTDGKPYTVKAVCRVWPVKDSVRILNGDDFGVLYGRQAKSLAEVELKCSVAEAQLFIDNFLADFDKLNDWIKSQHEFVLEHGYSETAFGRRRRYPLIHSGNVEGIKRQSVNSPIQGTASDITLGALTRICKDIEDGGLGDRVIPLITVHDAITFEVKDDFIPDLVRLAHYQMVENVPLEYRLPWDWDLEVGTSYGDVEKIDWFSLLSKSQQEYRRATRKETH